MQVDPKRGPFVDPREELAAKTDAQAFRTAIREFFGQLIGVDDLADVLLAEFVRRCANGEPAPTDETNQATMYDLREIARSLAIEVDDRDFSEVTSKLEFSGSLSFDSAPVDVPEPYAFAYLDPGGYERGLTLLSRFLTREIPASDRVVGLNHNDPPLVEITDQLEDLRQRIRKGNDLGDLSVEEREAAVAEIDQLQIALKASHVRVGQILARSKSSLKWIADKGGGALVGAAALSLLKLILVYFGGA